MLKFSKHLRHVRYAKWHRGPAAVAHSPACAQPPCKDPAAPRFRSDVREQVLRATELSLSLDKREHEK